jgi:RHS repeat-associated protein
MTSIPTSAGAVAHFTAKYDAWIRLVEAKLGTFTLTRNEYDGLGRRIVRLDGLFDPDVTYDYYYNEEWQLIEERKDGDADPLNQYVWHPYYVDALAIRYYDANTDNAGILEYYHAQDANFNVTAVLEDDGDVLERYAYTPYGEVTILNADFTLDNDGTDVAGTHFYTGRERDYETGLQLNRNRFYASHLGRWMNRDPIEYEGSPYNLYEYVHCMPTFRFDPTGKNFATIGYACFSPSFRGFCHGECFCVAPGLPAEILRVAMITASALCCPTSCACGDVWGSPVQPAAMMACMQTSLRLAVPPQLARVISCNCD